MGEPTERDREYVYEDDLRLRESLHLGTWIEMFTPDSWRGICVAGRSVGLLVRSGDSLKLLEVRKRRKPLNLQPGQTWCNRQGTLYRLTYLSNADYALVATDFKGSWSGIHRSLGACFGMPHDYLDPRDHGWTLVE